MGIIWRGGATRIPNMLIHTVFFIFLFFKSYLDFYLKKKKKMIIQTL